jgi:glycosyltransferase involved in cell wall biosynthesis
MNVLHVIPSVEAEDGGPATALNGMVQGIAARGAVVTVATTTQGTRTVESQRTNGIRILRFPRTLPGSWKYSRGLGRWLSENVRAFDIVHAHALFSYATIPACRNAIAHDVPLVLRPLGTLDEWCLAHKPWKKLPYLRLIERRHLEHAAAIHVTSASERDSLSALGFGDKARVIPLGVDHVATDAYVRTIHAQASHRAELNILFLSRLHPKKGLPLLIAALGRIRSDIRFMLRVAGTGPTAYVKELKSLAARAGIGDRVAFLGHVDGVRRNELFEWADLFVLPSYQENFALAAAEAMAAGVPLIVSKSVGIASEAEAAAIVIPPGDIPALEGAIRRLAADPRLRMRMALEGRALVEQRFTWEVASTALMALYDELSIARRRVPPAQAVA